MGQYYEVYNRTKNEKIIHDFDVIGGMKLTEHSYVGNNLAVFLRKKLATDWKGDRIYHIGDYASPEDGTQTASKMWDGADNILNNAVSIKCPMAYEDEILEYPIVINHDTKEYIDIRDADVTDYWIDKDGKVWLFYYDPLLLLTACGNGLGGGDYRGSNEELIGSWAGDRLEASSSKPEGYEPFVPHFYDRHMSDFKDLKNAKRFMTYGIEGQGYQSFLEKIKADN